VYLLEQSAQSLEMGKLYLDSFENEKQKISSEEKKILKYFMSNKKESNVFSGKTVFLQSKKTYSSAGMLIIDARDNGVGQVIGEKSSYKPCTYGDILSWQLPNTKITGGISHKIFNRPDKSKCNEPYLTPDILIEYRWENMLQGGGDQCWDWIIEHYGK
jgi:hypothetical protein